LCGGHLHLEQHPIGSPACEAHDTIIDLQLRVASARAVRAEPQGASEPSRPTGGRAKLDAVVLRGRLDADRVNGHDTGVWDWTTRASAQVAASQCQERPRAPIGVPPYFSALGSTD